jgi:hypothetical protein
MVVLSSSVSVVSLDFRDKNPMYHPYWLYLMMAYFYSVEIM